MALRGQRHGERPAGAEVPAAVVEAAHLRRIREHAARLVERDGVRLPRLPVREHHLHELVGAVVARVVVGDPVRAEVRGLRIVERGHHVPAGPPPGHVVEGGEEARDVEGLVVRGRAGGAQPEPARRRAHHREDGDRVHLHHPHAVAHRFGEVVPEAVGHREAVVEERQVELAVLQGAGDPPVVLRGHEVARGFRVTPRRGEVRAVLRLQKADHGDPAVRHPRLLLRWLVRWAGLYRTSGPDPAWPEPGAGCEPGSGVTGSKVRGERFFVDLPVSWAQRSMTAPPTRGSRGRSGEAGTEAAGPPRPCPDRFERPDDV